MSLCQSRSTTASGASSAGGAMSIGVGAGGRKLVDVIENRIEDLRRRDCPLGDPVGQSGHRRLLAVNQKHAAMNRPSRRNPARQFRPVGMAGIFVEVADAGGDLDLLALDAHGFRAFVQETAERALGLEADQQHGGSHCCHSQRFR